jgi:hypothetical protein
MNNDQGWGVSHLTDMPITATFGIALVAVLLLLVLFRFVFADVSLKGGVR